MWWQLQNSNNTPTTRIHGALVLLAQAVKGILEREAPGLSFLMTHDSLRHTPMAALSRAVAGCNSSPLPSPFTLTHQHAIKNAIKILRDTWNVAHTYSPGQSKGFPTRHILHAQYSCSLALLPFS
jgi:hypothetical protein